MFSQVVFTSDFFFFNRNGCLLKEQIQISFKNSTSNVISLLNSRISDVLGLHATK